MEGKKDRIVVVTYLQSSPIYASLHSHSLHYQNSTPANECKYFKNTRRWLGVVLPDCQNSAHTASRLFLPSHADVKLSGRHFQNFEEKEYNETNYRTAVVLEPLEEDREQQWGEQIDPTSEDAVEKKNVLKHTTTTTTSCKNAEISLVTIYFVVDYLVLVRTTVPESLPLSLVAK